MNKKIVAYVLTFVFFGILFAIGNLTFTAFAIVLSMLILSINFYFEIDYRDNKEEDVKQIRDINFSKIKSRMYGLLLLDVKYGIINSINKNLKLNLELEDIGNHIKDKKKYYTNLKALSKNNFLDMQTDIERNPIYNDMTFKEFTEKDRLAYYVENIYD